MCGPRWGSLRSRSCSQKPYTMWHHILRGVRYMIQTCQQFYQFDWISVFSIQFGFLTVPEGPSEVGVLNGFAVISAEASILMLRLCIFCVTLALHRECLASRPASSTVERKQYRTQQDERTFQRIFLKPKFERRLLYILRDSYITYVFILFSDFQMLWRITHIKQNEAPCAMRKHRTPATSGLPWAPWSFGRALECESPLPWGTVQHVQPIRSADLCLL